MHPTATPSPTVPASVINAPKPTASGLTSLDRRAAALALIGAAAVPVIFLILLITLLMSSNYNLLDWME
ncbi:MAG: hypothetical protein JO295_06005 [Verrucomicrobia bacterium]|nr:hypothetical protein [Verrucomicrobiota bacterium]